VSSNQVAVDTGSVLQCVLHCVLQCVLQRLLQCMLQYVLQCDAVRKLLQKRL